MGSAKAAVLPVPVWAVPIRSLPARTIGKARSWIGVGVVNPIACVPRTTSGERPKSLNDTRGNYPVLRHHTTVTKEHNGSGKMLANVVSLCDLYARIPNVGAASHLRPG